MLFRNQWLPVLCTETDSKTGKSIVSSKSGISALQRMLTKKFVPGFLLFWLGASIAIHAFPSTGDTRTLLSTISAPCVSRAAKIVVYPIVGIISLGAIGSFFWLNAVSSVGVAIALPTFLVILLA